MNRSTWSKQPYDNKKKNKNRMTKKAAQCTRHSAALVLGNFSRPFPSFLSRCIGNPSLLLGLCLYNPFSLSIVAYYFLLPGFICICCLLSLSHTLSCCGTQLLIGVVHAWVGQKFVKSNILQVLSYRSKARYFSLNAMHDANQVLSR